MQWSERDINLNWLKLLIMIDRQKFYDCIKSKQLFKTLKQSQVNGINFIFDEWERQGLTDLRWLAYMLATAYHETATTFAAIEEYGKGKNYKYGKKVKRSGVPYTAPNKLYYGRGLVQLTWYENYELMGKLLKLDLLNNPELCLDLNVAIKIMFEGMLRGASSFGDFTGKCLEMYFNKTTEDWVGARKIINGTDKADLIAGYAQKFHICLI